MTEIYLDELEFKPEDFLSWRPIDESLRDVFPEWKETICLLAQHHANEANRILREKLAKAPEVEWSSQCGCWNDLGTIDYIKGGCRARLVAIEEIK